MKWFLQIILLHQSTDISLETTHQLAQENLESDHRTIYVYAYVQLKRAKTLCAKRMQYLGGSEYSCYVDSNEVPLEKKVCVLLITCLLGALTYLYFIVLSCAIARLCHLRFDRVQIGLSTGVWGQYAFQLVDEADSELTKTDPAKLLSFRCLQEE